MKERYRLPFAHKDTYRYPDKECSDYTLGHYKLCEPDSVVKPYKAKQKTGKQTIYGIGFQVFYPKRPQEKGPP